MHFRINANHRKRNGIDAEKLLECTSAFQSRGLCQCPWGMELCTNQECTVQCQESLEIRLNLSSRMPRHCPELGPQGASYILNRNVPAGISGSQGCQSSSLVDRAVFGFLLCETIQVAGTCIHSYIKETGQ